MASGFMACYPVAGSPMAGSPMIGYKTSGSSVGDPVVVVVVVVVDTTVSNSMVVDPIMDGPMVSRPVVDGAAMGGASGAVMVEVALLAGTNMAAGLADGQAQLQGVDLVVAEDEEEAEDGLGEDVEDAVEDGL